MPDELELQKLKKEYPGFFEKVPPKLIELVFSEKTASQISGICLENGIKEGGEVEKIAYHIASALLGRLPLEILPKALVVNEKIAPEVAEKISQEANRLIFSKVKGDLTKLYQKEVSPKEIKEKPKRPPGKDVYRELIE